MQDQECAGAVVLDDAGRLLMIRRARPPAAGTWSLPGGRCLPAEPPATACVREVAEETGLRVDVIRFVGRVWRDSPNGGRYVIDDFLCRAVGGVLVAGDDAADAQWMTAARFAALNTAPGLRETLLRWNLLPW